MKSYSELTEKQKEKAVKIFLNRLLQDIVEGFLMFDEGLQDKIDKAFEQAERMKTPWFAHEYIMDTCAEELRERLKKVKKEKSK